MPCPKCGGELTYGFGLCGGGYGPYELCLTDNCDYFAKGEDREDMPGDDYRWEKDAPDHWRCEVEKTPFQLSVWLRADGKWIWELWDSDVDPDNPEVSGEEDTHLGARRAAEAELKNHV
jgi:hypothetical protein